MHSEHNLHWHTFLIHGPRASIWLPMTYDTSLSDIYNRPSLTYKALWSAVLNMRMLYFLSMYSKQKWKCNFFIFCKRLDRYGIRVYFIKGIYIDLITGGSMYKHYYITACTSVHLCVHCKTWLNTRVLLPVYVPKYRVTWNI